MRVCKDWVADATTSNKTRRSYQSQSCPDCDMHVMLYSAEGALPVILIDAAAVWLSGLDTSAWM